LLRRAGVAGISIFADRRMKLLIGFSLLSSFALAATNNCPNTTASSPVSNGVTTDTTTIPGTGPGNDLATLAAGCTAINLTFSNFTLDNHNTTGTGSSALTLSGTYFAETPAGVVNPLLSPDNVLLATVRGTAATNTDGDVNDGSNNWVSNSNSAQHAVNNDLAFLVNEGGSLGLSGLTVTITNPVVQGNATGSVTVYVCEGGTATGIVTTGGQCTGGTLVSHVLTLTTSPSQSFTFNFALPQTRIDVTSAILLQGGTASAVSGFDTIGFSFIEVAPEPSTFVLIGSAFAFVGLLRRRQKR